jgi:hypothetical protein
VTKCYALLCVNHFQKLSSSREATFGNNYVCGQLNFPLPKKIDYGHIKINGHSFFVKDEN